MKYGLLFIFLVCMACNAGKKNINTIVYSERTKQYILLGPINKAGLQTEPFKAWYNENYSNYQVDTKTTDAIPSSAWEEVKITVILATWCPDARRELPRFLKILDHARFCDHSMWDN